MKLTEFVSLVLRLQCMYVMMPFCESVCVCVRRDRDQAFIDAYLPFMHSEGCEHLIWKKCCSLVTQMACAHAYLL